MHKKFTPPLNKISPSKQTGTGGVQLSDESSTNPASFSIEFETESLLPQANKNIAVVAQRIQQQFFRDFVDTRTFIVLNFSFKCK